MVGPTVAVSLEPLAHCPIVASISHFDICSSELIDLVPHPYSCEGSTYLTYLTYHPVLVIFHSIINLTLTWLLTMMF